MTSLTSEELRPATFELALGPLVYRFVAHDAWGAGLLADLGSHLEPASAESPRPDRIIHLSSRPQGADNCKEQRRLPERFESWLPAVDQGRCWAYRRNLVNTVWSSTATRHCFWTAGVDSAMGRFRYQLPWDLILHDLTCRNGGLIHGGLAEHLGSGLLLLAPPGGGKSTTLATAPTHWRILSDDAALIWPHRGDGWQATPLPSWGMLNETATGPTAALRILDRPVPVRAMVRLYQAGSLSLHPLAPVIAAPLVYRALCEYPAAFLADPAYRPGYFRTAAALARQVACSRLELPLHAPVWPELEALLERPPS